ncbi:MAG TPA: SBBP repeat-containing protein, partial [Acidobacteriota bacterium]|nr:SBBP repeat-containing protein [Acidobacteriota bacterium]
MMPIGVAKDVQIQGEGFEKARFNYFLGNNPKKWRSNVPAFRALLYKDIYPGIDLKFYGNDSGRLEYDLILKPGADPSKVKFAYEGIQDLQLDDSGNLLVELLELNVIQKKPRIFQKAGNVISRIDGKFNLHSNRRSRKFVYGFKLDDYDKKLALFIDPVISYSTYLGGSEDEFGRSIAVDDAGSAYITGVSLS